MSPHQTKESSSKPSNAKCVADIDALVKNLLAELPGQSILPDEPQKYKDASVVTWATQHWEYKPACIIRPSSTTQVSKIIKLITAFFAELKEDSRDSVKSRNVFAVRAGGHSPNLGASCIDAGILIDLSLFKNIEVSKDSSSVTLGTGCRWAEVSKVLDTRGLAVAGGRNNSVGVGGLTLGGGLSFFSPRVGMVCSNVIEYEVVVAGGEIVNATASNNADLWRALKGGGNNFGIVTNIKVPCFPCGDVWSGYIFIPSSQTDKVIAATHDYIDRSLQNSTDPTKSYDEFSSGPITSFTYISKYGLTVAAANLVHTSPPKPSSKLSSLNPLGKQPWPKCWDSSGFKSIFRLWSTCKVQSLTSAYDEFGKLNPPGRRQMWAVTTVKNDMDTLKAAHEVFKTANADIKAAKLNDVMLSLVFQPLIPEWARKGDPNPLGFDKTSPNATTGTSKSDGPDENAPLVVVSVAPNWRNAETDEPIKRIVRKTVEQIDAYAKSKGTSHRYRYMNYCADWQDPFEGYGDGEKAWLQGVSKQYDPTGLFQEGCQGGYKLFV